MDIKRVFLFGALAFIVYSLWNQWELENRPSPSAALVSRSSEKAYLLPSDLAPREEATPRLAQNQFIHVETDVLSLDIDTQYGNVTRAALLNYPANNKEKNNPYLLLKETPQSSYVAESGLLVSHENSVENVAIHYQTKQQNYVLKAPEKELVVTLEGETPQGVKVKKEFIFKQGSYLIDLRYILSNASEMPFKGYMNTQLIQHAPEEDKSSMFHVGSFTGASYSSPGHHKYQKVSFKDMSKSNLDSNVTGGWIAMQEHYFLSAWIPKVTSENRFYTKALEKTYTIGAVSSPIEIAPAGNAQIGSQLYLGPEVGSILKSISPGLDLTIDYGLLWFLSSMLFSLMKVIYSVVGNWGWTIVLVTVLIKLAFYRLSATSYKSMANMRKLQPKLQALRERYGDDKAKMSQETMALYREEKVNPLGGCLPVLIQIPVFIALYWVLLESVELRQAPFILWIHDLASADPYHVLPIIMGGTMLIQQKLNPAPPDPMQAKVMMFLPVLFTGLFWGFPAGLVLYWVVNNTLSILQQWIITRKYSDSNSTQKPLLAK